MTDARKTFQNDLDKLEADVVVLGGLAAAAVEAGTAALLAGNLTAAEEVIAEDKALDELTHAIESHIYELLARQQPVAVDLRMLVATLRVIHELERSGDLMVKVAKATRRLYPRQIEPQIGRLVRRMAEQAAVQLRLAVEAFADRDRVRAAALPDMDDVIDDLQKDLFQAIFDTRATDEPALERAVQFALLGRYFERIGDHAANVAERVEFMVTGHFQYEDQDEGIEA
jgi:phosphate transport system protein